MTPITKAAREAQAFILGRSHSGLLAQSYFWISSPRILIAAVARDMRCCRCSPKMPGSFFRGEDFQKSNSWNLPPILAKVQVGGSIFFGLSTNQNGSITMAPGHETLTYRSFNHVTCSPYFPS
jgi:hypothetical protein